MKKLLFLILLILSVGLALLFHQPQHVSKVVWIKPGSSALEIARLLKHEGVLISQWPFRIKIKFSSHSNKLKPGEYHFENSMSLNKIIDDLVNENVIKHKINIPEGFTTNQITLLIKNQNILNAQDWDKTLNDPEFKNALNIKQFEGYLFPSTYYVTRTMKSSQLIQLMVANTKELLENNQSKFNDDDIVTLASIIEKETGNENEYPIISSVFHNRLKLNMRLQSDPTVIYGVDKFDGNITKKHLTTSHPYNTYTKHGLPVGPICNPGEKAIKAAMNPSQTDFLYFVSKGNGEHIFSKDYKTHLAFVKQYQLARPEKAPSASLPSAKSSSM